MSDEIRATIPRPSICRAVVIAMRDRGPFPHASDESARELPGTVIRLVDEATLRIEVAVPYFGVIAVDHRDLTPDNDWVWYWPPRT